MQKRPSTISPSEATAALAAANTTMRRSRRAAIGKFARTSLIFWGVAWMVGFSGAQLMPDWRATALWAAVGIAAYALTRWHSATSAGGTVSGWEGPFHRTWWALALGSFALTAITADAQPAAVPWLVNGTLWGIAYIIYGTLAEDRPVGILGVAIVLLAVALRILSPHQALLLFGLGAGGAMAALGVVRTVRA